MSIPTIGLVLDKVPGLTQAIEEALQKVAERIKSTVPDAAPVVDDALADGRAAIVAYLGGDMPRAQLAKVAERVQHLLKTGYSTAKPDAGDVA